MKSRITQYIIIILILSGITGGYFYFSSDAAQKINASKVNNLTSGLVGYWTFDGADMTATTALDKSISGRNGTLTGTTRAIGKIGQALNFDGSSYVSNFSSLISPVGSRSICTWFKTNSTARQGLVGVRGSGTSGSVFTINRTTPGNLTYFHTGGTTYEVAAGITTNVWHHACVTLDTSSAVATLYLNGTSFAPQASFSVESATDFNGVIGAEDASFNSKFSGSIDETRIYSRALSQSEITELYQQGQTKINASQTNKLTSGLVGYWTFDGNNMDWSQTAVVRDQAGSAHGTLIGMDRSDATIGKIGQGIKFDTATANDYVAITTSGIGNSNTVTMTAWVKTVSLGEYDGIFMSRSTAGQGIFISGYSGNPLTYMWDDEPDEWNANTGLIITPNEWHFTAVVIEPTKATVYLDGSSWTNTKTHVARSQNIAWRIGEDQWSGEWNGSIDEVRLYNRSLSASEITELYQQGQTKINASQAGKLTSGLVSYYTFDGSNTNSTTATDVISGYNGALTSTTSAIGKIGQALSFNGSASVATVTGTTSSNLNSITSAVTMSAWIKLNALGNSGLQGVVTKGTAGAYGFKMVYDEAGNTVGNGYEICGRFGSNTGWFCDNAGSISVANEWYHVVFTADSTNVKWYINNVLRNSATGTFSSLSDTSNMLIGSWAGSSFFNGKIDEVRVYNRALSASEVGELYNMGR